MRTYLDMLDHVLTHGRRREDRTGVGTIGVFGHQVRFDLADGFPLLTTKRIHTRSVLTELAWMLAGRTDVAWLTDRGVSIWDEWARPDGTIGPGYGHQWRSWSGPDGRTVDQIANGLRDLQQDPFSRRHLVSAWNVTDVPDMALPPCHTMFQLYVEPDAEGRPDRLSCQLYQRSADIFLGVPFNIASYAALTQIVAHLSDLAPGELVHTFGDLHLYTNHVEQAKEQLAREPRTPPLLEIMHEAAISRGLHVPGLLPAYDVEDFVVVGYDPHPTIKAAVAV